MTREEIRDRRRELQRLMRDYAEFIWEAGGETVTAHSAESNALLGLEGAVCAFRDVLETHP